MILAVLFANSKDNILVERFLIMSLNSPNADGIGLPPEEKPKLCDDACKKELENVPMVTMKYGLQYKHIKVGEGPSPLIGFQQSMSKLCPDLNNSPAFCTGLELMELLYGHYDIFALIG
ncbi:hypothetical protein GOBAR_DD11019 [Gossypium barbadense]|nr:hypothetical protein GOBAR_DD11019 [Gossypium barbadense]